ncbi:MAG TPA: hypothetical protein VKV95_06910 [Terriglobia bacterium]|nr:hypothetical protein [Terriglobia bacterium]
MPCPICKKRKAQRYCPAKGENICSVCCGTEREVTIDCPSDCAYLIASRTYGLERKKFDWSKLPFADIKIPSSFAQGHVPLLNALTYTVSAFARDNASTVDTDVVASLQALAESYRTLSSGLYYEKPPDHRLQRELYDRLKGGIEEFKKAEAQNSNATVVRDGDIRDALIFFTQLGATYMNGRPKGRAYLDMLRSQIKSEEFAKPASNIVLLP